MDNVETWWGLYPSNKGREQPDQRAITKMQSLRYEQGLEQLFCHLATFQSFAQDASRFLGSGSDVTIQWKKFS